MGNAAKPSIELTFNETAEANVFGQIDAEGHLDPIEVMWSETLANGRGAWYVKIEVDGDAKDGDEAEGTTVTIHARKSWTLLKKVARALGLEGTGTIVDNREGNKSSKDVVELYPIEK